MEKVPSQWQHRAILVVDDSRGIREVVQDMLTLAGFDTDTAADGVEAQVMLRKRHYDLLLIDISMPVMNGIQLYQCLKEQYPQYSSKVVFMSAGVPDHDTQRYLNEANRPFLEKPFSVEELMDRASWGKAMANDKGVRVFNCPIGYDYCYPSCHWRKGNRCYYTSKRGRQIINR